MVPPVPSVPLKIMASEAAIPLAIARLTYSVLASCPSLLSGSAVGAVGIPVNTGLVNMTALDSFVTFPRPTWAFVVAWGLPVSALCVSLSVFSSLAEETPVPESLADAVRYVL